VTAIWNNDENISTFDPQYEGDITMESIIRRTTLSLSHLDSRTIRLLLVLLTLILFILGAGAPGAGGGFSG
jgi:hypothetical protein